TFVIYSSGQWRPPALLAAQSAVTSPSRRAHLPDGRGWRRLEQVCYTPSGRATPRGGSRSFSRRGCMKYLLTSAGITNNSIHDALEELLGKPIAESSALIIPTALYPFPGGAGMAWRAICGKAGGPLSELGWQSLGVLELTALPSIDDDAWIPTVQETDALLV